MNAEEKNMWLNKHESRGKHTRTYTDTQATRWYTVCVINSTSKRGRKEARRKYKHTVKEEKKDRKAEKEKEVKTERGIFIKGDRVIFCQAGQADQQRMC